MFDEITSDSEAEEVKEEPAPPKSKTEEPKVEQKIEVSDMPKISTVSEDPPKEEKLTEPEQTPAPSETSP